MDYPPLTEEMDGINPVRRLLPRATAVVSGNNGVSQNVVPGAATQAPTQGETLYQTLARLRQQAEEAQRNLGTLRGQEVDVAGLEQYGRTRAEGGQNAMLNALAAQFAGERFSGVQDSMLKRSMAAQQEMKLGQGMVTPDGKFIRDPYAARDAAERRAMEEAQFYERQAQGLGTQIQSMEDRLEAQRDRNEQRERDRQLRRELGGRDAQPYFTPVQTAQGVQRFNARTGQMELITDPTGKPIVGAAADPQLQGDISQAKRRGQEAAEADSKSAAAVKRSTQLLETLDQAEAILKQSPTASGVGALVDAAGNIIGVSRDAANKAAQLESISGWLVSNVPRMEGPQSDFDVKNYQKMAGLVGDRTKPVEQRLAALQEVRKLQEKYKALNQGDSRAAPAGIDPKVWNAMTPEEKKLWQN
jgi:hypothetical protein